MLEDPYFLGETITLVLKELALSEQISFFFSTSLPPVSSYPGKAQQPQEQRYPFLSVCAVFSCVQTMVWLPLVPVFGIFNVHTDVAACDCSLGLYGHRKTVCTGN